MKAYLKFRERETSHIDNNLCTSIQRIHDYD